MPAATFFIASLAALEPPRRPVGSFYQTAWSLSTSPQALAAAQEPRPVVGPGQATQAVPLPLPPATPERKRQVTVLPAPAETDSFDELKDPAAPDAAAAAQTDAPTEAASPDAAAAEVSADISPADPAAADPFEDELSKQIKPAFDPLEQLNRISFSLSQFIDRILLRPIAMTYYKIAPKPLRDGMRNVLSHWGAPVTFVNDLLQLKPKRALKTLGRFLINTLLGLGGIFDVAKEKKFNLPFHGNSFSYTLAFYGVKPGPYLYVPVLGPTTLLDQVNLVHGYIPGIDHSLFRNGRGTVFQYLLGLEDRATNDEALKALLDDSVDPYASFRETWLQDRKGEIARLKAPDGVEPSTYEANPLDSLDDPLVDPAAPATDGGQAGSADTPAAPSTTPAAPSATPAAPGATPAP